MAESRSESPEDVRRRLLREIEEIKEEIRRLRGVLRRVAGGVTS